MKTDVIVCNYRTPEDLDGFLRSYYRWGGASDLFVVNNAPTHHDEEVVESWRRDLDFKYVSNADNVGYARAVNHAARLGARDVIAIFNADTRLTPGLIDQCTGALMSRPEWGILGPRQLDDEGRVVYGGIFGTLDCPEWRGGFRALDGPIYDDVRDDAVTVMGAAYFVKRRLWTELTECPTYRSVAPDAEGAFLPTQHYYEETFCSYHAQAHDQRVVYFGPAVMTHRWHKASELGGHADQQMSVSREYFRRACDAHGIAHD